jgi:hypothetical protein
MNGFHGDAILMQAADIPIVAHELGIESAALRAVLAVESAGSGFDKAGRPKALFERHHFYKNLRNQPDVLQVAVDATLAYPRWGERPYPKGSDAVYAEIEAAYEIAPDAALRSTSWGLGQIMGSNYALAGCKSPLDLVEEAMASEINQLRHMANFIKSAGLLDNLQEKDWAGFARGYNGPGYAKNSYDVKLELAYMKYASA